MKRSEKIYVVGHAGMVGAALIRRLRDQGYGQVLTRTRAELDLLDQAAVTEFFSLERYSSADEFSRTFRIEAGATYCVCHGSLQSLRRRRDGQGGRD